MGDVLLSITKTVVGFGLIIIGGYSCVNSDWYIAHEKSQTSSALARATPHVVREADGCKVYAFERDGKDHYFTRCGEIVTTERTYSEACGKGCVKQLQEVIVTKGNQ